MDDEVQRLVDQLRKDENKELKTDGLSPGNVLLPVMDLPSRKQPPGSPALTDDDCNANARASIQEGFEVDDSLGRRNGKKDKARHDGCLPP